MFLPHGAIRLVRQQQQEPAARSAWSSYHTLPALTIYQYQKVGIRCKDYMKVVYAIPTCKVSIGDDKNSLRALEIRFSVRLRKYIVLLLLKSRHYAYT